MLALLIAVAGLPPPIVPEGWGVNIHFTDERPSEIAKIARAFRWVRMDFAWSSIERERGRYDFAAYDRLLAALERHGVRPYLILDYGNDLYGKGSPRDPESRAAFCRWVAAAMARYKGRGVVWEMWNEPNIAFWQPKPNVEEYVLLARAVGETIRRVAPKETFVGPATSGFDWPFLQRCLDAGLLKYWDAVSVHPYRQTEPETVEPDWLRLRAMLDRAGDANKPMLSGEWGYSELYSGQTREKQAQMILRQYLVNLPCGVPISIWYDWKDDGADPKEAEHHFGTVEPGLADKPAFEAAERLSRELAGFRFVTRLHTKDDAQWVLLFRRGSQARLAVWTTAAPSKLRLPGVTRFSGATSEGPRVLTLSQIPKVVRGADLSPLLGWPPRPWAEGVAGPSKAHPFVGLQDGVDVESRAFGEAVFIQVTRLLVRQPVGLEVFPARDGAVHGRVSNAYGRRLDDLRFSFARRESSAMSWEGGVPAGSGEIGIPDWAGFVRLDAPGVLFPLSRRVPRFVPLALSGATASADGDPKIHGSVSVAETPEGVRLAYDFEPGWRFAEVHPADGRVEGRPTASGLWVRGDGSGDLLRMRYTDATGQTFQPDGGPIDWKGWRYVSFPLDGSGGRWGGANDGVVHWPIRISTAALVDMPGGRGGKGEILISRGTLAYPR